MSEEGLRPDERMTRPRSGPSKIICPACHGALGAHGDDWRCAGCTRVFPSHHGIADLRLEGDPYLSIERDRERADLVVAALDRRDFPALLDYYWSLSEETPPALRQRFVVSARRASVRARHLVQWLIAEGVASKASRVLEIGSGTAPFLAEAVPHVSEVIGLDIALRWLHVGRRRLLDAGLPIPPLVCAGAQSLPFPDGRFDLVVCVATIEFTSHPGRVFSECARVLRPGGSLFVNTVNRFSLAVEPHVGLWGVGFLPRAWQAPYVRARGRGNFAGVHLLSHGELDRLGKAHFSHRQIGPARIPDGLVADLPTGPRMAVRAYRRLQAVPLLRALLRRLGPEWDVLLTRD